MIGLILFSHAGLAEAFRNALQVIAGNLDQVVAIGVDPRDPPDEMEQKLQQAIPLVDDGDGVVIVTDLFGGSPANVSLAQLRPGRVEVVSGLNLPMLLRALDLRRQKVVEPLVVAKAMAKEGRENIVLASEILGKENGGQGAAASGGGRCPS